MKTNLFQNILRIVLGSFMVLAAIGHFTFQREEFQAQVPDWLPFSKDFVVIASGLVELGLGLAMIFWNKHRKYVGFALATFFVLIFPGNVAQYLNGIDAFGLDTDQARFIRLFFQPVLIFWALWSTGAWAALRRRGADAELKNKHFYDFEAENIRGEKVKMQSYKGKVVLAVNTATKCGLTPQLHGLESLYQEYSDRGLVIVGFPSNQFANQEPGDNEQIAEVCQVNYGVSFPMYGKIKVNGEEAHPLFAYLKASLGGFLTDDIKWNFTKFLIDKQGRPVKRFSPYTKPEAIKKDIKRLLNT